METGAGLLTAGQAARGWALSPAVCLDNLVHWSVESFSTSHQAYLILYNGQGELLMFRLKANSQGLSESVGTNQQWATVSGGAGVGTSNHG